MKMEIPKSLPSDLHEFQLSSVQINSDPCSFVFSSEEFGVVELLFGGIIWIDKKDASKIIKAVERGDKSCVEVISLRCEYNRVMIVMAIYDFDRKPVVGEDVILKFQAELVDVKK